MNENVKKIFELFKNSQILSILESKNNYIVSVCDKKADVSSVTESIYAVNKKTFKVSDFSYFNNPDEYAEATNNVLYKYDSGDELTHWGILGMKWGVRRYQNKDGSLTTAGKKRRSQLEAELKERESKIKAKEREKAKHDKLRAKSAELDERERALRGKTRAKSDADQNRKKTISEMSDDELRARANRMILESNYLTAQRNLANLNPPKVSAGKKFISGLMNDVIAPAAKNAGRAWAENFMKDKLGLNKQDSLTALQREVQKARLTKELKELKHPKKNDNTSWENELKRQQYESNKKKEELNDIQYQIALYDAKQALKKRRESNN